MSSRVCHLCGKEIPPGQKSWFYEFTDQYTGECCIQYDVTPAELRIAHYRKRIAELEAEVLAARGTSLSDEEKHAAKEAWWDGFNAFVVESKSRLAQHHAELLLAYDAGYDAGWDAGREEQMIEDLEWERDW